jgi:hypothetical protein
VVGRAFLVVGEVVKADFMTLSIIRGSGDVARCFSATRAETAFGRFSSSIGAEGLLLLVKEASGLSSCFRLPLVCAPGRSGTPLDFSLGSDHHTRGDGAVC